MPGKRLVYHGGLDPVIRWDRWELRLDWFLLFSVKKTIKPAKQFKCT